MKKLITLSVFVFQLIWSVNVFAKNTQVNTTVAATGSKSWAINNNGVHFSLTQIQPQQGQAFYGNRGFTLKHIDDFVRSCVFMAVIRNDNKEHAMQYQLKNWVIETKGKQQKLLLVDDWLKKLSAPNVSKSSLIAFKWAQFPEEQTYQPNGDWNQGMLSVGLKGKQQFTIKALWAMNGKSYTSQLTDVQCAK